MDARAVEEKIAKGLMILSAAIVVGSLILILATILVKGVPALSLEMLTQTPKGGYYLGKGGGILNAILGSMALGIGAAGIASLISLPVALYLNVYLRTRSRVAFFIRFSLDVLSGIPSIVYGAFGFTVMVWLGLRASLLAGIFTVSLLILPMMIRGMDEVLKTVSLELKEASFALGATKLEVAFQVILKQALPGILTAILIAFGRGIGDAASVLFTASFTDSLPTSLTAPVATLPLAIFFQLGTPFPQVQARGYASAVVLTVMVLAISITSRVLLSRMTQHRVK